MKFFTKNFNLNTSILTLTLLFGIAGTVSAMQRTDRLSRQETMQLYDAFTSLRNKMSQYIPVDSWINRPTFGEVLTLSKLKQLSDDLQKDRINLFNRMQSAGSNLKKDLSDLVEQLDNFIQMIEIEIITLEKKKKS